MSVIDKLTIFMMVIHVMAFLLRIFGRNINLVAIISQGLVVFTALVLTIIYITFGQELPAVIWGINTSVQLMLFARLLSLK